MVYDVLVRENEAYIASNQGLYWLKDGLIDKAIAVVVGAVLGFLLNGGGL